MIILGNLLKFYNIVVHTKKHVPSELVTLYTRDSTFFSQKTKEWTLKKINSINGLVSVFFTSKDPLRLSLICIE